MTGKIGTKGAIRNSAVQGSYIEIDKSKMPVENIFDFSTKELDAMLKKPFTRAAALADEEVLIYGGIPQEAIIRIEKGVVE